MMCKLCRISKRVDDQPFSTFWLEQLKLFVDKIFERIFFGHFSSEFGINTGLFNSRIGSCSHRLSDKISRIKSKVKTAESERANCYDCERQGFFLTWNHRSKCNKSMKFKAFFSGMPGFHKYCSAQRKTGQQVLSDLIKIFGDQRLFGFSKFMKSVKLVVVIKNSIKSNFLAPINTPFWHWVLAFYGLALHVAAR